DRGGDRAEDQQRERGASREPVEEADQEGTAAEPDEVDVRSVWRAEMELRVAVSHAADMGVLAPMFEERAEGAQENVAAQKDEHEPDRSLEGGLEARRDRQLEPDHGDAGAQERERVPGAPE